MMPARIYRLLPLLGSRPVRPYVPYQPSDWGTMQRYTRRAEILWRVLRWQTVIRDQNLTGAAYSVLAAYAQLR
jgi:hypothetical protein